MKTSNDSPLSAVLQQIAGKVVLARQELDELALQLSLGKVEAKDKFEEFKKDFRIKLSDFRRILQAQDAQQKPVVDLISRIIALETALRADKADSEREFNAQRRALSAIIGKLEDIIKKKFSSVPAIHEFIHDIEILRLKLEILRLKFTVRRFKIKDSFRAGMDKAVGVVHATQSKVGSTRARYRDFRDEIGLAYDHMKKAIKGM